MEISNATPKNLICPNCDSAETTVAWKNHFFDFGDGRTKISLSAFVPVNHCEKCQRDFLSEQALNIQHEACCKHLRLLTPNEIKEIRIANGLSQAGLAQLSGIGIASIARWESGQLLQGRSNDNLLRLLEYPDNRDRLKNISDNKLEYVGKKEESHFKGRALSPERMKEYSEPRERFTLRKVS